jgi:hypothetical protein
MTAARLRLNTPHEFPQNWEQINRNLNDDHSDPMEISGRFWLLGLSDWWQQQEETHSKFTDLANVAGDTFSIIPHSVGVEVCFSLGHNVSEQRLSETTGETHQQRS